MAERSNIEWCDATFNPWIGCAKVSPACDHCYAERDFDLRLRVVQWGAGQARKRTSYANWKLPRQWNAKPFFQCEDCGHRSRGEKWREVGPNMGLTDSGYACPRCNSRSMNEARRRVFCASLADVFDNEVPATWRQDLFDLIRRCENLDFLLLTKRVGNVTRMLQEVASMLRSEHGAQTEREPGLQAGPVGRTGDRRGGPNLARGEADFRSLDRRDEGDTVHASSGGAEDAGRLPAGAGDDRRKAALRGSGTAGVASLQGTDPAGPHGQSQGRREGSQSPGQLGAGDVQRAAPACGAGTGGRAPRREGLESPQGAGLGGGRPIDASPARAGLAGEGHCGEIRDDAERGVARLSRQDLEARADLLAWIEQWLAGNPPRNVWLGATICNQAEADRDIPKLLATPAAVRFLSVEPMLGPISFEGMFANPTRVNDGTNALEALDWVIVGGESGPHARPMHPQWARDLRDQCAATGVPFLFKQWGEWTPDDWGERPGLRDTAGVMPSGDSMLMSQGYVPPFDDGERLKAAGNVRLDGRTLMNRVGKKAAGRLLDGRTHDAFPKGGA